MTTTTTPNPVPVEDHQFPGHPYRFQLATARIHGRLEDVLSRWGAMLAR